MDNKTKKLLEMKRAMNNRINPDHRTLYLWRRFKNAERTSDETAALGKSWKEYWQLFTQKDFPMTCPFCGKPLAEKDIDGCHIYFKGFLPSYWLPDKYIIPGHHDCNMELGKEFSAKTCVNAIEAIEKEDK